MERNGYAPLSALPPNTPVNPMNVRIFSENDKQLNEIIKRVAIIKPEENTAYVIDSIDVGSDKFYGKITVLCNPDGFGNNSWSPRDRNIGSMHPIKAEKLLDQFPSDGKGPVMDPRTRESIAKLQNGSMVAAVEVFLVAKEIINRHPRPGGG